ncbi:hypothetical protein OS493_037642 [Desmophyllum pertusum]|uniref:Uncharacterized protein n=1 Tax=Desmophyllum pertusum TaxID=174260 RepID=A0A9X0CHR1_9CNID|nr:hypothetical protein OS493_037642 [Desmophyllum pertusum]
MTNGKKKSSSRIGLRSETHNSSSENNNSAAERSSVTRFMAARSTTPLEEGGEVFVHTSQEKTPEETRYTLLDIQTKVGKILADNAALRKDDEDLKISMQQKDQQFGTLSTAVANLTIESNGLKSQLEYQNSYIQQLEENLDALASEHDSLEQYTRKYNVEVHGVPEHRDENLPDLISSIAAAS